MASATEDAGNPASAVVDTCPSAVSTFKKKGTTVQYQAGHDLRICEKKIPQTAETVATMNGNMSQKQRPHFYNAQANTKVNQSLSGNHAIFSPETILEIYEPTTFRLSLAGQTVG